jgi:hypothetical protein
VTFPTTYSCQPVVPSSTGSVVQSSTGGVMSSSSCSTAVSSTGRVPSSSSSSSSSSSTGNVGSSSMSSSTGTGIVTCGTGTYLSSGVCVACPMNYYQPSSSHTFTTCLACPMGQTTQTTGVTGTHTYTASTTFLLQSVRESHCMMIDDDDVDDRFITMFTAMLSFCNGIMGYCTCIFPCTWVSHTSYISYTCVCSSIVYCVSVKYRVDYNTTTEQFVAICWMNSGKTMKILF